MNSIINYKKKSSVKSRLGTKMECLIYYFHFLMNFQILNMKIRTYEVKSLHSLRWTPYVSMLSTNL
jgi:hypothetical protein